RRRIVRDRPAQRHAASAPHEPRRRRALGRRDQVDGADLVILAPPSPVAAFADVTEHFLLRRQRTLRHGDLRRGSDFDFLTELLRSQSLTPSLYWSGEKADGSMSLFFCVNRRPPPPGGGHTPFLRASSRICMRAS